MGLFKFFKDLAWNSGKKFFENGCSQLAAAITYYTVFSIFPFTIFVASLAGLMLDDEAQENIVDEILEWIPPSQDQGRADLESAIDALSTPEAQVAGLIGLVVLLWSASSMFNSVRRALNIIFDDPQYSRPWVPQKLIDLGLVLGLGLFFVGSVLASTMLTLARNRSDGVQLPGDSDASSFWTLLDYGVATTLAFMGFTLLYLIVPSRPRRLVDVWLGALVGAIAFNLVAAGFGFYVSNFTDLSAIYGSLAAVMAFLLWVFISAQVMLLGAAVAAVYPRVRTGEFSQESMGGMKVAFPKQVEAAVKSLFVKKPPAGSA